MYSSNDDSENDNFSYFDFVESDTDFEKEEELEYNPEVFVSDDDEAGCCHWSTEPNPDFVDEPEPDDSLPDFGHPSIHFDDNAKPSDIIERIMDDAFIFRCIEATNEHGSSDPNFVSKFAEIPLDEKGICLFVDISQ